MNLILWRHAEAQKLREGVDDLERPLTSKGEKQAKRMAQWLDRQLPELTRILVSPARRRQQTVVTLGRKFKTRAELAPGCSAVQLLELVQWPEDKATVLVVGHQPTLGETISHLLGLGPNEYPFKRGGIWWLRSRARGETVQTVVVTVQSPDVL